MKLEDIKKNISKEEFEDLYCNQFSSKKEIGKHFNICISSVQKLIEEWDLKRDQDKLNKISAKRSASNKESSYKNFTQEQVKELKDLYLNQNKSYEELREYFHLTRWTLDKIIRDNDLKKDRKTSASLVLKTKYENAGSKEKYFEDLSKTREQSFIQREGSVEEHYKRVAEKCRESWLNKSSEYRRARLEHLREVYLSHPDKIENAKQKRITTNLEKYGIDNTYKLASYVSNSQPNKEFATKLTASNINYQSEFYLATADSERRGFRYDFKVDNTLVEIDPWPFHNITFNPIAGCEPIPKSYHLEKSLAAKSSNYRCIHVFDWDDQTKIISSLSPKKKIYARQCKIGEVSAETADTFLNNYHFQDTCRGQAVRLGLYYQEDLVEIMTFGKPRYNKKYQWELLRLCTRSNFFVVGGAERLYRYFLSHYAPDSIISYCDLSKFTGDVYTRLGMIPLRISKPTRHWYSPDLQVHITDNLLRQRGFDQLYGDLFGCYGKGTSNEELMKEHGFVEIYDCGQQSFEWKSSKESLIR